MSATIFSKFYWSDWQADPCLRRTSLAGRGLWMEMLSIMATGPKPGYLSIAGNEELSLGDLAKIAGASEHEVETLLAELERNHVFSRDRHGRIFSRRIVNDRKKARLAVKTGKEGGNPDIRRGTVPKEKRVRPFKRSDSPAKTRRIWDKSKGMCHWCSVPLAWELKTDTNPTTLFHVDHVIPICDGGTNDDENLVAACAKCNHARARKDWVNPRDNKSDTNGKSDTNPDTITHGARPSTSSQSPEANSQSSTLLPPYEVLEAKLREAAGWQNEPHPNLAVVGPILELLKAGADLELDVLAVVRAKAPTVRKRIGWRYFVDPITEAFEARRAAGSKVKPGNGASAIDHTTWTENDYESAVFVAKRKGIWPSAYGPAEKIPQRLMDAELADIIRRSP